MKKCMTKTDKTGLVRSTFDMATSQDFTLRDRDHLFGCGLSFSCVIALIAMDSGPSTIIRRSFITTNIMIYHDLSIFIHIYRIKSITHPIFYNLSRFIEKMSPAPKSRQPEAAVQREPAPRRVHGVMHFRNRQLLWGFHGISINGWFIRENPNLKLMIKWGNPHLWKPPYQYY